jgi:glycosyltransferase involved in cell wall biosynthesis
MILNMKICIATHHFPPKYLAGAELYAYRLARNLLSMGHEVEVVTIESITQGELTPKDHTDVYDSIPVHRLFSNFSLAERTFPLFYRNPYLGKWFKEYFSKYRPDILHVNSGYLLGGTVLEEAHSMGIPTALTLHEYWFQCPLHTLLRTNGEVCDKPVPPARCKWCLMSKKRRYRILDNKLHGQIGNAYVKMSSSPLLKSWTSRDMDIDEIIDRRAYLSEVFQKVDLVISPSKFLIDKMEEYGFHHPRLIQLPYGLENIPTEIVKPYRKPNTLRVGYLGRISPEKGVDLLFEALKKIPGNNISLNVYGHINVEESYHQLLVKMAKKDQRIHFYGRYNPAELTDILSTLDVTVAPSRWYENRPGTILEAFAHRTPVIASNLGGMIELIDHEVNGLLFNLNDADDLARQLVRLLNEPDLLAALEKGILPVPGMMDEIQQIEQYYRALVYPDHP